MDGGEIEITLRGEIAPLRRSVEEAVELLEGVQEAAKDTDEALAKNAFGDFKKKAVDNFKEFSESAAEAFADAIESADHFGSVIGAIGNSLKNIGFGALTVGATAATKSLYSMAKAGVSDTSALEDVQIQMIGLTHSIQAGNKAMSMAVQYYKNNPFNRFDVTDATKSLIQYGVALNDIPDLLDKIGKVSLSTGESIQSLATIYQKTVSQGKVGLQDIYVLANRGIDIWGAFEKATGKTMAQVREETAKGGIAVEDFKKAFDYLVDDDAMEQFNNTFSRQMDRFKGRLSDMKAALAGYTATVENGLVITENGLYKAVTNLAKKFADVMTSTGSSANPVGQSVIEGFQKIGVAFAKIVDQVTKLVEPALNLLGKVLNFLGDNSEVLVPLLGLLATKLAGFASSLPMVGKFLRPLTDNFGNLYQSLKSLVTLHPGLSALIALFGVGLVQAYKNDEKFKATVQELVKSLKELFDSLMQVVRSVLPAFVELVKDLANSGAVRGVLQGVASALSGIAKALATISPSTLGGIISFFVSLKMFNKSPIMFAAYAVSLLIAYIKELGGISEVLKNLPEKLLAIGHNMMTGLLNGLIEGAKKVWSWIKDFGNAVVNSFKNIFQIHSPSKVMYEIGQFITLGLAEGITDNESAVQLAMNNLASDILKLSQKVVGNKADFGLLNIAGQYQEWKKVTKMFTQGSEQYNTALEKMEEARKQANLEILSLQKTYNDELDSTIKKISSFYGLFDSVSLEAGKNAGDILKDLDKQVASVNEWAEAQRMIKNLGLDEALIEELQGMGVESVYELQAIANMTSEELSTLNDLWLKKQAIANEAGVEQMSKLKDQALTEINELKSGIDGATVDVTDVGGRLVENIAEGVYGAMPTLESAFSQLDDYIAQAVKKLNQQGTGESSSPSATSEYEVPDAGGLLKGIEGSLEGLSDMLPKMLIGTIGAGIATVAVPKLLKWLGSKVFSKGGALSEGIAGLLFKSAEGGLGAGNLSQFADILANNTKEGGLVQNIISKIKEKNLAQSAKEIGDLYDYDGNLLVSKSSPEYLEALKNTGAKIESSTSSTAKTFGKSAQSTKTIATDSTSIGNDMQTTGGAFSKVNQVLNTIIKGAVAIIAIAAAIAAMAGALWLTYNALKGVNWGEMVIDLVAIAGTVAVFGVIATVLGNVPTATLVKGILAMIGIAADVAVLALAMRFAYDKMTGMDWEDYKNILGYMAATLGVFSVIAGVMGSIPIAVMAAGIIEIIAIAGDVALLAEAMRHAYDLTQDMDWEKYQASLGHMAETLAVMGGLSSVLGLVAPLAGLGWLSILAVCDELTRTAQALKAVHDNVPDDLEKTENKVKLIKKVLVAVIDIDLGQLIGSLAMGIQVGPLTATMNMYAEVAEQLVRMSTLEIDDDKVSENLQSVALALDKVRGKTGIISAKLRSWADEANADSVESAGRVILVYGEIVDSLNKLSSLQVNQATYTAIDAISGVVNHIRNSSFSLFNLFGSGINTFANDVEKIKSIVEHFIELIPTVKQISTDEYNLSATKATALKSIQAIEEIVWQIGEAGTGGWIESKEKDLGAIQSIINKFTEIIPVAWQVSQSGVTGWKETAKKQIKAIEEIIYQIGECGTAGYIESKERDLRAIQSIVNKFTEIAPVAYTISQSGVSAWEESAKTEIGSVQTIVRKLGSMDTSWTSRASTIEWMLAVADSIGHKLIGLEKVLADIKGTDYSENISSVFSNVNALFTQAQISVSEKLPEIEQLGLDFGDMFSQGIKDSMSLISEAGANLQSVFWSSIEAKMDDEYQQGAWLAQKFAEGIKSVSMEGVGQAVQSSLWWGIQNRMNDEYWQGRSMGETFRQGLYDIDYANSGWWAVQGFINGAYNRGYYSGSDGVYWVGYNLANTFLNGLKKRADEGSPWKTTMESGAWAVEGLIEGIKGSENALVTEAESLADQVVEALTMDNLEMSPTLSVGSVAPSMDMEEYDTLNSRRGVVIEQTNNNFTQYDLERVNNDLAWQLSIV